MLKRSAVLFGLSKERQGRHGHRNPFGVLGNLYSVRIRTASSARSWSHNSTFFQVFVAMRHLLSNSESWSSFSDKGSTMFSSDWDPWTDNDKGWGCECTCSRLLWTDNADTSLEAFVEENDSSRSLRSRPFNNYISWPLHGRLASCLQL